MRLLFILLTFLLIPSWLTAGGSSFSGAGFGLMQPSVNARSIGMGKVLLAVPSRNAMNLYNPAALWGISNFKIESGISYEGLYSNTARDNKYFDNVNITHVAFGTPLGKRVALAFGISRISRIQYDFSVTGKTFDNNSFREQYSGSGGLQEIHLTTAYKINPAWTAGLACRYTMGKVKRLWSIDWDSDNFIDTDDKSENNIHGPRIALGTIYEKQPFTIGLFFAIPLSHDDNLIRYGANVDTSLQINRKLKYPAEIGLGGTYNLNEDYLLGMDVTYTGWSHVRIEEKNPGYRSTMRISIGGEKQPSRSLSAKTHERFLYRAGMYMQNLYVKNASGNYASEYFVTAGLGIPFYKAMHVLDFAVEAGTRGSIASNKVRDTIIRFTLTVSGGERWFQNRKKR